MIALARDTGRNWMADAACRNGYDPDLWHPGPGQPTATAVAVAVCNGCPVKERCGDYAVTNREQHGVWGGLTIEQRNRRARQGVAA